MVQGVAGIEYTYLYRYVAWYSLQSRESEV
jgi:hypothetical protein